MPPVNVTLNAFLQSRKEKKPLRKTEAIDAGRIQKVRDVPELLNPTLRVTHARMLGEGKTPT